MSKGKAKENSVVQLQDGTKRTTRPREKGLQNPPLNELNAKTREQKDEAIKRNKRLEDAVKSVKKEFDDTDKKSAEDAKKAAAKRAESDKKKASADK